jgi:hypothetical protein
VISLASDCTVLYVYVHSKLSKQKAVCTNTVVPLENVTEYLSRIGSCETSSGCIFTHLPSAVILSSLVWVQWHPRWPGIDTNGWKRTEGSSSKEPPVHTFLFALFFAFRKMEDILHASIYLLHYMIQDYRKVTCSFGS